MPLAGKGMLLTSMDIDPAEEADFNRWYDYEHLEERVAIDGFLEARRYVAHAGSPKYLCLYSTKTIDVLDSAAYRAKLDNPTDWSKKTMAQFKNMIRAVARITASRGTGRGAVLGIVRYRPHAGGGDAELAGSIIILHTAKADLAIGDQAGPLSFWRFCIHCSRAAPARKKGGCVAGWSNHLLQFVVFW